MNISIDISDDFKTELRQIVREEIQNYFEASKPTKYYSLKEASVRTGKAISTLYTHHCQGKLRAFKSGRQLRFSEEMLVDYLEGKPI